MDLDDVLKQHIRERAPELKKRLVEEFGELKERIIRDARITHAQPRTLTP